MDRIQRSIEIIKRYLMTKATKDELREFATDVLKGLYESSRGDSKHLRADLAAWYATAEVGLNHRLVDEIQTGRVETERGEAVEWSEGHFVRDRNP